jgi:hypothetical protein
MNQIENIMELAKEYRDAIIEDGIKRQALRAAIEQVLAVQPKQEPVACLVGMKGSAFDPPETKRAYTYAEQPGNIAASKLGRAFAVAALQSAGDSIDRGLALLKELEKEGFGVFEVGAEYTVPKQELAEFKHVCNLWIDPVSRDYIVDRCDHPPSECIPAYIRTAHQPQSKQEPVSIKAVAAKHGINMPNQYIPTMDDAIAAGDGVLMNEQAALLRECRAALDSLIQKKPTLAGLLCGSTTLGNLRALLYDYRPQGVFSGTAPQPPREWVGLTYDEMQACWNDTMSTPDYSREGIYRAIEAKLREKNGGTK